MQKFYDFLERHFGNSFLFRRFFKPRYDVVYILKNGIASEELRYSLRSVEQNFYYNNVWFCGGAPANLKPDKELSFIQRGTTKYEKANSAIKKACENEEITENFYLFNDDFFITDKVKEIEPVYIGDLFDTAVKIDSRHGYRTKYSTFLRKTGSWLYEHGYQTLNYDAHMPLLVNKKKGLEVFEKAGNSMAFRSLYGNIYSIEGHQRKDVKIGNTTKKMTQAHKPCLSTSDKSFNYGAIGKQIKELFSEPSKYE